MSRIVFFVSSMRGGGAERVAALLCNYWAGQGQKVWLVPTFSGRGGCVYPLDERVRLEYLADRVAATHRSPVTLVRRFHAMRSLVREWQPDAIVSFLPHVNVAALLATCGLRIPVVVSERTFPPAMPIGPVWSRLRRWTYPMAETVVIQTQQGRDWVAREIPRARRATIPNPCTHPLPVIEPRVDPADWIPSAKQVLLAVGRLEEEKGFIELIDAFKLLANRFADWSLIILGEGSQRVTLETCMDERGIKDRVVLPGRVGNLPDWYQRADLYAMSSHFEGFPNTLLEAMAHGLPAVSLDCDTGPADLIRNGVDGILVPPEAGAIGLSAALSALMADEAQRQRMGQEALAVRHRFSMGRIGALWDQALGLSGQ